MLSERARFLIGEAVTDWARRAPDPAQPVIAFPGYGYLTASSLALAVEQRSEAGEAYLRIIEHNLRRTSLEDVLERFRNDPGSLPPGPASPPPVGPPPVSPIAPVELPWQEA